MATEDRVARGESPADAERGARREFGNVGVVKDVTRDMWRWHWPATEFRWALRNVRSRGGRGAVVIALLALAIAAVTVVFSVADSLVFHRVTYRDPGQLVGIQPINSRTGKPSLDTSMSITLIEGWRRQTDLFQGIEGHLGKVLFLAGDGRATQVEVADVTPGLIPLLGAAPRWGRQLTPDDARQQTPQVVLISEGLARSRFGDPSMALGKTLDTTDAPLLVVGVMPRLFRYPSNVEEIWRALDVRGPLMQGFGGSIFTVARIRSEVPLDDVTRAVEQRAPDIGREAGARGPYKATIGSALRAATVARQQRQTLLVLLAAAACLLLTACSNVVSLELAGAVRRARAYAIHLAIGASRGALCRIALIESGVLVGMAGLLGTGFAMLGIRALAPWLPERLSNSSVNPIDLDGRALTFLFATIVLTWLLTSLPVVFYASQSRLLDLLKVEDHGVLGSRAGGRVRRILTVAEVAIAVLLMIGGVLYIRSYLALLSQEKGFDPAGVAEIQIKLPPQLYPTSSSLRQFGDVVLDRLRSQPGVVGATRAQSPTGNNSAVMRSNGLAIDGAPSLDEPASIGMMDVTPDYFSVLGVPLRSGRLFTQDEPATNVVINEVLAKHYWPNGDAVGHRFQYFAAPTAPWLSIVGVVGHVRNSRDAVGSSNALQFYTPRQPPAPDRPRSPTSALPSSASVGILVRIDKPSRLPGILQAAAAIDSRGIAQAEFVDAVYARQFDDTLLATRVIGLFGILALVLATAGIYAVMAFLVATRSREIGLRMALGAGQSAVVRLVMTSSLRVIMAGIAIGVAGALTLSPLVQAQLFGVTSRDAGTYFAVAGFVLLAAVVATWRPARHAARVDPVTALRC